MLTRGARLREERERLGFNQAELASVLGQTRETQGRYEAEKRSPDWNYLDSLRQVGADILYILTGERSSQLPLPAADRLPPRLRERLRDAIEAVEEGLSAVGRDVAPPVKAELVMAAYDILASQGESASADIIRLVRA